MKNSLLKFYIVVFYFCSTFVLFAVPGSGSDDLPVESEDTATPMPIDEYWWILMLIGLVFVFIKLKQLQLKKS